MVDRIARIPAILVDSELVNAPNVARWLSLRVKHAAVVLLVENPDGEPDSLPVAPDVVITNTGRLANKDFKTAALAAVQEKSKLAPVVAIDDSWAAQDVFTAGGVLVTLSSGDV